MLQREKSQDITVGSKEAQGIGGDRNWRCGQQMCGEKRTGKVKKGDEVKSINSFENLIKDS